MTLIEQAAKRLEELRRAGVELPWAGGQPSADGASTLRPVRALEPALAPVQAATPTAKVRPEVRARSSTVELNLDRLEASGFLVPAMVRSNMASEFRDIKRVLLKNARDEAASEGKRRNVIMVSSALAGEGKTFCAINLAMSIAMEVDNHVLLVDADVLRPSILRSLGVPSAPGLMDLLADPARDMSSLLLKTNVPKLTLLPSGGSEGNSTERLASGAMERLLDELATRYADRIVVIDTPPLLLTTESRTLASRVGQLVMVVEAYKTPQASVAQAFAAVEQCPLVYAILNKGGRSGADEGEYYDYRRT